jgi:hypothetical protein
MNSLGAVRTGAAPDGIEAQRQGRSLGALPRPLQPVGPGRGGTCIDPALLPDGDWDARV